MIKYEWRTEASDSEQDQIRALLTRAAEYDKEPEFSTIEWEDVAHDLESGGPARILLVSLLAQQVDKQEFVPERIASVLRLTPLSDDVAAAQLVVDPDLRSRGITTLFIETAGFETHSEDGWFGSGFRSIRSWARGNHPASGRLSDRWLIQSTQRSWKIVRPHQAGTSHESSYILHDLSSPSVDNTLSNAASRLFASDVFGALGRRLGDYTSVDIGVHLPSPTQKASLSASAASTRRRSTSTRSAPALHSKRSFSRSQLTLRSDGRFWPNSSVPSTVMARTESSLTSMPKTVNRSGHTDSPTFGTTEQTCGTNSELASGEPRNGSTMGTPISVIATSNVVARSSLSERLFDGHVNPGKFR